MKTDLIQKVIIVGGGSAGWMTAAMMSRTLGKNLDITLIESDDIATVGVGEATIPPIQQFNQILGIDENEFLAATQGTFKLAIQFENWGQIGESYMHTFGGIGKDLGSIDFHHYWLRSLQEELPSSYWDYSLNYQAAKSNKFNILDYIEGTQLAGLIRAYHFDAGLYAKYLRKYSEPKGVKRVEGQIIDSKICPDSGYVQSVTLKDGKELLADLFIDCSGFRALLIEQALKTGYEDWSQWLPCDRAIAIPTKSVKPLVPYTRSIAHEAGWQWRIPLQHRTGNGLVYCSDFLEQDKALDTLMSNLDAEPLKDPNFIRFQTGRRKKQWNKNVVSIGLSSGFLEPLESTSLHLIQSGVVRLVKMFPRMRIEKSLVDEYNQQSKLEFEQIRDFIILHYHQNQRTDSEFWTRCREMSIPDSLRHKIELFRSSGHVHREKSDLFTEIAWYQVMMGQNLLPEDYHPMADTLSKAQLAGFMGDLKSLMQGTAGQLSEHEQYIARHCQSSME